MSEPIKVGDLVRIVYSRACCEATCCGVEMFIVAMINEPPPSWKRCAHCGIPWPNENRAARSIKACGLPLSWLRKIDPPADAISEDARRPMKEPA